MRFTDFLLIATLLTGLIWLMDILFFKKKRQHSKFSNKISDHRKPARDEPLVVEYARSFFPVLLIVLIFRSFIIEPFRIPSASMRPTLYEGDFIIANKFNYGLQLPLLHTKILELGTPKRGDVIVFKRTKNGESMDMIKRVVGLPGDKIEYKDNLVYVNGVPAKQIFEEEVMDKNGEGRGSTVVRKQSEYLDHIKHDVFVHLGENEARDYPYNNVIVPEKSYFAMGDNRDNSDDSRYWGFVKEDDIIGRAFGVWLSVDTDRLGFSLDCLLHCIRWHRFGQSLGTELAKAE